MIEKYYNLVMIAYLVTGFIMAFDVCYYDSKHCKQHGLLETGIIIMSMVFAWLPLVVISIYWYWLKGLYAIITEEEK